MTEISLRGGEDFWEQVIACAESALRGESACIQPGDGGVGQEFRINFIPVDPIPGCAVAIVLADDCLGFANWFGRADEIADP